MNDTENQIWMEYIEGYSGKDLTVEMLEQAALELGCFQGRLWVQPGSPRAVCCLGDVGYMERAFSQWHVQKRNGYNML